MVDISKVWKELETLIRESRQRIWDEIVQSPVPTNIELLRKTADALNDIENKTRDTLEQLLVEQRKAVPQKRMGGWRVIAVIAGFLLLSIAVGNIIAYNSIVASGLAGFYIDWLVEGFLIILGLLGFAYGLEALSYIRREEKLDE